MIGDKDEENPLLKPADFAKAWLHREANKVGIIDDSERQNIENICECCG